MKIGITGASGMVGSSLSQFILAEGHQVKRFVRRETRSSDEIFWNPETSELEVESLEGLEHIVNLAGESISSGRWTESLKEKILQSRIKSTRLLVDRILKMQAKPKTFLCASAIGYYGDRGDEILSEDAPAGSGFLADVCKNWEAEALRLEREGVRVVRLRIGIVLSPKGGALQKMLGFFKAGLGSPLGSGTQWMSWISLDDLVSSIFHCLKNENIHGAVNACSPEPVTNLEFSKTLSGVLHRPSAPRVPAFALRLLLGELADSLLLASTRVNPAVLVNSGFHFSRRNLEGALKYLLGK